MNKKNPAKKIIYFDKEKTCFPAKQNNKHLKVIIKVSFILIVLVVINNVFESLNAETTNTYVIGSLSMHQAGVDNPTVTEILQPYKDYIESRSKLKIVLKNVDSIDAMIKGLKNNTIQMGYVTNIDYIEIKRVLNIVPMLRHLKASSSKYKALLVVRKEAPYKSLADLKGKTFTYSTKTSSHGYVMPNLMINKKYKMPLEKYFGKIITTKKDSDGVLAVYYRKADAVYTTNLILEFFSNYNPRIVRELKVIDTSEPLMYGPIFYYPPNFKNLQDMEKIKSAIADMNDNVKGKQILLFFKISGWEEAKDSDYDSLRNIIKNMH